MQPTIDRKSTASTLRNVGFCLIAFICHSLFLSDGLKGGMSVGVSFTHWIIPKSSDKDTHFFPISCDFTLTIRNVYDRADGAFVK